jgi:GntR family transcriptional regulator
VPLDIQITPGSPAPIFRQIVDQIRLAAAMGQIPPGEQLPSVRALAQRLVINPNTVARAYADLTRDGILDTQQGKGVFIAPQRNVFTKSERLRRLEPTLDAFVNDALSLSFSPQEIHDALDKKIGQLQRH